ncbi:hypothetical protein V1520DRAFT_298793 [Lipomyces starkeyi]|uniref:SWIM-type domain-containing protein n=1 Tax=Lipomyces starkeyi NRRL Y-11557 TaxID=675824 RepID=A0A1E3Q8S6_LIPST|nr:hypothetical protein LIPSTDRAFT_244391 [Lipomyces starkeyi NRRL Y-11557]
MELVYAAVMKKKQHQEEDDTWESCRCSTWNRYLLPCSHRIQLGVPLSITQIDPRWWVHPEFPPVNVAFQRIDAAILLELKDPVATLPRKGRPKGTRRLQTSAEVVQKIADRIEKVRRCGSCKNTGHDRRKCPKLLSNLIITEMRRRQKNKRSPRHGRTTRPNYKMMNRFPGTTAIIAMMKSRKCGLMYSAFLRMESEDVEKFGQW